MLSSETLVFTRPRNTFSPLASTLAMHRSRFSCRRAGPPATARGPYPRRRARRRHDADASLAGSPRRSAARVPAWSAASATSAWRKLPCASARRRKSSSRPSASGDRPPSRLSGSRTCGWLSSSESETSTRATCDAAADTDGATAGTGRAPGAGKAGRADAVRRQLVARARQVRRPAGLRRRERDGAAVPSHHGFDPSRWSCSDAYAGGGV
jgi:hypothetical protein